MSYTFDNKDESLVISGFEGGIASNPYSGLTNAINVDLDTIPSEASVNFDTKSVSGFTTNGGNAITVTTSGGAGVITGDLGTNRIESNQAFWVSSSTINNLTAGTTVYYTYNATYQGNGQTSFDIVSVYGGSTFLSLGAGTATIYLFSMGEPRYFTNDGVNDYMIDSLGQVWSDRYLTNGGGAPTSSWTYTGNLANSGYTPLTDAHGNGIVYWRSNNLAGGVGAWDGYLFIFRDGEIDYAKVNFNGGNLTISWVYGWNPTTATANNTNYLTGYNISACPHDSLNAPDGRVYFTDRFNIGKLYQTNQNVNFSPSSGSTYTYLTQPLLPVDEIGTCLAPLGTDILIGGIHNKAYEWDTFSTLITQPILLPENYVSKIVTVNMNAYIFAGNTGRIYISNGSQANEFAKIPNYLGGNRNTSILGAVSPYFTWKGATYLKNHLLFSVMASDNSGQIISGYGGVWTINLNNMAMWVANKLSYQPMEESLSGYASALAPIPIIPTFPSNSPSLPAGMGYFAGWNNNSSYGLDTTISTPAREGVLYSEVIPIGTFNDPQNNTYVEYKLATPLLAGEGIDLYYRPNFGTTWTLIGTDSTAGHFSNTYPSTWKNLQWIQFRIRLYSNSTTTTSFVRLTQFRLVGFTGRSAMQQQILSL